MAHTINSNFDGRWNDKTGQSLQLEIDRKPVLGIVQTNPHTRFCEHCQRQVPRPKFKLYKGWMCEDCKNKS